MSTYSFSQVKDSASIAINKKDTVKKHSPKKAMLMSACLPGLGQIYNKKYWKAPVIYVGLAALGYAFSQNQILYYKYRDAYIYRTDENALTVDNYESVLSNTALFDLQQHYHRNRDLTIIGLGLLYVLNVIDASVDGHLYTFDVSDDLSLNVQPNILYNVSANHCQAQLLLKFNF